MELQIVSLKGLHFTGNKGVHVEISSGYGFYVEGLGYLSFKEANEKKGVKSPYTNTKKVLQSIIDDGGLVHYNNIDWLTPIAS